MSEARQNHAAPEPVLEDPEAALERMYLEEYLLGKGYTLQRLRELPEADARQLMVEASAYASTRLAEVETRAHFVQGIHGAAPPL